jgi:hypothetical protein
VDEPAVTDADPKGSSFLREYFPLGLMTAAIDRYWTVEAVLDRARERDAAASEQPGLYRLPR